MDVLLISQVFPPQNGGSGRWLWELYRRLDGVRVHVAAAAMPGDAEFDRTAPLPIERLPLRFSGWGLANPRSAGQYVRALRGLRRMMLRSRPQAIHCGKCLPEGLLGLGLSTAFGVPYVCYAHGEELMLARRSHELRLLTALVLRRLAEAGGGLLLPPLVRRDPAAEDRMPHPVIPAGGHQPIRQDIRDRLLNRCRHIGNRHRLSRRLAGPHPSRHRRLETGEGEVDRKSTRLNSSHRT